MVNTSSSFHLSVVPYLPLMVILHWGHAAGDGNWILGCIGSSVWSPWRRWLTRLCERHSHIIASVPFMTSYSTLAAMLTKCSAQWRQPKKWRMYSRMATNTSSGLNSLLGSEKGKQIVSFRAHSQSASNLALALYPYQIANANANRYAHCEWTLTLTTFSFEPLLNW